MTFLPQYKESPWDRRDLKVSADESHPELHRVKGNRLKRGKSWLGWAEDANVQVYELSNFNPDEKWIPISVEFHEIFCHHYTCRDQKL